MTVNTLIRAAFFALPLSLALASAAYANITGATVQPTTYKGACPVTTAVTGTIAGSPGTTFKWRFDRYDGQHGTMQSAVMPAAGTLTVHDSYNDTADVGGWDQLWISAIPGQADVYSPYVNYSLTCVKAPLVSPGVIMLECGAPRMDDYGPSRFGPNDTVTINGCGFGAKAGKVRVSGTFPNNKTIDLAITSWTNTKIVAQMPDMNGVPDQKDTMWVVRADGAISDAQGFPFYAKRTTMVVPQSAFTVHCASNSQLDRCQFLSDPNLSITSLHSSTCCINPATGTDTYDLTLANGWRFVQSAVFEVEYTFSHEGYCAYHGVGWAFSPYLAGQPDHILYGATTMHLQVDWSTRDPRGSACYEGVVKIEGPVGIPFSSQGVIIGPPTGTR